MARCGPSCKCYGRDLTPPPIAIRIMMAIVIASAMMMLMMMPVVMMVVGTFLNPTKTTLAGIPVALATVCSHVVETC